MNGSNSPKNNITVIRISARISKLLKEKTLVTKPPPHFLNIYQSNENN